MLKKTPFLDLLKYMERTGKLYYDNRGLCGTVWRHSSFTYKCIRILNEFEPVSNSEVDSFNSTGYWGSDSPGFKLGVATDLRKTIIAFCAVLNNEIT